MLHISTEPKYLAVAARSIRACDPRSTLQVFNETLSTSRLLVRNARASSRSIKTYTRRRKLIGADEASKLAWIVVLTWERRMAP
jgi:hypothetical protein